MSTINFISWRALQPQNTIVVAFTYESIGMTRLEYKKSLEHSCLQLINYYYYYCSFANFSLSCFLHFFSFVCLFKAFLTFFLSIVFWVQFLFSLNSPLNSECCILCHGIHTLTHVFHTYFVYLIRFCHVSIKFPFFFRFQETQYQRIYYTFKLCYKISRLK